MTPMSFGFVHVRRYGRRKPLTSRNRCRYGTALLNWLPSSTRRTTRAGFSSGNVRAGIEPKRRGTRPMDLEPAIGLVARLLECVFVETAVRRIEGMEER